MRGPDLTLQRKAQAAKSAARLARLHDREDEEPHRFDKCAGDDRVSLRGPGKRLRAGRRREPSDRVPDHTDHAEYTDRAHGTDNAHDDHHDPHNQAASPHPA